MFTLKIENYLGEIFELTHDTKKYAVIGVQGLTLPPVTVNTSTGGAVDGSFYNSSHVEQRNIVIDIIIRGDIESNRKQLYRIFNAKRKSTIYFKNKNRDVKIEGYVELLDGDLFTEAQQMQISIICPRPYFHALEEIYSELSLIVRELEFPVAFDEPIPISEIAEAPSAVIENSGDVECGVEIMVTFSAAASEFKIVNSTTQKYFGLTYSFQAEDELKISTISGALAATVTRDAQEINVLNGMQAGSEWIKLEIGENVLTFTAGGNESAVEAIVATALLYGGV